MTPYVVLPWSKSFRNSTDVSECSNHIGNTSKIPENERGSYFKPDNVFAKLYKNIYSSKARWTIGIPALRPSTKKSVPLNLIFFGEVKLGWNE